MATPMANRLRELREAKGLTRKALAELVGTGPTMILKLESGDRRLSDLWASRFAPHLDVQPYEIFMPHSDRPEVRWVPVIGSVSCGNWQEAIEHPQGFVPAVATGARVFGLRPEGDSMDLLISEDGYALVDPDEVDLLDGKVYVIANGERETTAKRYKANPARLVPCSTNPAHKEILVGSEPFMVVGRVIQVVTPV